MDRAGKVIQFLDEALTHRGLVLDVGAGDGFTALGSEIIVADSGAWERLGFEVSIIDTAFECETLDDARRLFGFYSGERGRSVAHRQITFRVACFVGRGAGMKS